MGTGGQQGRGGGVRGGGGVGGVGHLAGGEAAVQRQEGEREEPLRHVERRRDAVGLDDVHVLLDQPCLCHLTINHGGNKIILQENVFSRRRGVRLWRSVQLEEKTSEEGESFDEKGRKEERRFSRFQCRTSLGSGRAELFVSSHSQKMFLPGVAF